MTGAEEESSAPGKESEVECRMRALPQPPYLIPFTGQGDAQRSHTVDDRPYGGQEVVVDGALEK